MEKFEEVKIAITKILDQFLSEARPIWPMSQFSIPALKSFIFKEYDKLKEEKIEPTA